MKKLTLLFCALLITVIFAGCTKKVEQTEDGTKITEDKIVTDDVSYVTDDTEVTIRRNKVTKQASIEMVYKIKDEDEYDDFMGEQMTMVPFLVNTSCSLFTTAIFDPEAFAEWEEDEKAQKDDQMDSYLEGYTTNKITIKFVDAENNEKIANCESTKAGLENIKFDIFKDYSDVSSLFGIKIGEYDDEESSEE